MNTHNTDALLTPPLAAKYIGLSTSWLAKSRMSGRGPRFLKLGSAVRYRACDLDAWLEARYQRSTCDPAGEWIPASVAVDAVVDRLRPAKQMDGKAND